MIQPFTALCRSGTSASTARINTFDIQVLVSVPRPPAHLFLNAPHIFITLLNSLSDAENLINCTSSVPKANLVFSYSYLENNTICKWFIKKKQMFGKFNVIKYTESFI